MYLAECVAGQRLGEAQPFREVPRCHPVGEQELTQLVQPRLPPGVGGDDDRADDLLSVEARHADEGRLLHERVSTQRLFDVGHRNHEAAADPVGDPPHDREPASPVGYG